MCGLAAGTMCPRHPVLIITQASHRLPSHTEVLCMHSVSVPAHADCPANLPVSIIFFFYCSQTDMHAWRGWLHAHIGRGRNWEHCRPQLFSSQSLLEKMIIAHVTARPITPLPCSRWFQWEQGVSRHRHPSHVASLWHFTAYFSSCAANHWEWYVLLLLINPHCLPQYASLMLSSARIKEGIVYLIFLDRASCFLVSLAIMCSRHYWYCI